MNINLVSNLSPVKVPHLSFMENQGENVQMQADLENVTNPNQKKNRFNLLDKFEKNIKNKVDLNDTVTVPRTIFKGYLGFMAGTTLGAINSLIKVGENGQNKKLKCVLGILSAGISLLGTWFFVRPYVIKDSQKKD